MVCRYPLQEKKRKKRKPPCEQWLTRLDVRREKKTSRLKCERWLCGGCWHHGARCWCCCHCIAPIPVVVVLLSSLPVIGHPYPLSVAPARCWWSLPVICPPAHHSSSMPIVHHPCPLFVIPAIVAPLSNVLAPMLHPMSSGS